MRTSGPPRSLRNLPHSRSLVRPSCRQRETGTVAPAAQLPPAPGSSGSPAGDGAHMRAPSGPGLIASHRPWLSAHRPRPREPWKAAQMRHAVRRLRGRLALSRLAISRAAPVLLTASAASLGAAESVSEKRR